MNSALITSAMLEPLTEAVTANVGAVLPVGLTLMGIMLAISVIPRIIYKLF